MVHCIAKIRAMPPVLQGLRLVAGIALYWYPLAMDLASGPIILFDARCVLCSANARFVLRFDRARRFRLAAMQGAVGAELFRRNGLDPADPESILVVDGARVWRDSDAVIAIYAGLGWPWRAAVLARIVPCVVRDPIYRWVARNRYRIFGRRETCWLPAPEFADRLL